MIHMLKKIIAITFLLSSITLSSFAYVYGGSNFSSYSGYPEFSNYYVTYNMSYNDLVSLKYEVQRYLENANNDIRRIKEAQEKAIREYNDAVQSYNMNH